MKVTFKPDNNIFHMQDMCFFENIPSGIRFECKKIFTGYKLTAPGYGILTKEKRDQYGNGSLYVKEKHMFEGCAACKQ